MASPLGNTFDAILVLFVSASCTQVGAYMPLSEPSVQSYFPPLRDHVPAFPWRNQHIPKSQIPRYTNLTEVKFFELIRTGQPFVVDDCAATWPYRDWSCKQFGDSWPTGNMKAEYSRNQHRTYLGDGKWWKHLRDGDRQEQHLSEGEMVAGPYIWHVKDEEPIETKRDVQRRWQGPYFMNKTAANHLEAWDSFEFWFSLPKGGAFAHSDSYCEMTISAQLKGNKTWRMMMYPESQTVFDSFDSFDRGIYQVNKWSPEYEFKVGPGQCVIFPPGYMHETYNKPAENNECTVASTFQYNLPFPVKYIRAYLPRLFSSHLVWAEDCHSRWEAFHSFVGGRTVPTVDVPELTGRVDAIFGAIDADKNGHLERAELIEYFSKAPQAGFAREVQYSWTYKVSAQQRQEVATELVESRVDDTVGYNDVDGDGRISHEELFDATQQWNVLNYRYWSLRRLNVRDPGSVKAAMDLERRFDEKYRCAEGDYTCLGDNYFNMVKAQVRSLQQISVYNRDPDAAPQHDPWGGSHEPSGDRDDGRDDGDEEDGHDDL